MLTLPNASIALLALAIVASDSGQIWFDDVSKISGITHVGHSFGASFGDFSGDGRPDLWVSNHAGSVPSLYLNTRDGRFIDVASWLIGPGDRLGDKHGAAFVDIDDDGDQDLFVSTGADSGTGSEPSKLLVNDHGRFIDAATWYGLDYPLSRSRTPSFVDLDGDGRIDLIHAATLRPDGLAPTGFFMQGTNRFVDVTARYDLPDTQSEYVQAADLDGDGVAEFLVHGSPLRVFRNAQPLQDITAAIGLPTGLGNVFDSAIADFDGDLRNDLFLAQSGQRSEFQLADPKRVEAAFIVSAEEHGISIDSGAGPIHVVLYQVPVDQIHIGASGHHPSSPSFDLAADDRTNWGMQSHLPGMSTGAWIGWDQGTSRWLLYVSSPGWRQVNAVVTATDPIVAVDAYGFDPTAPYPHDALYLQQAGQLIDRSRASGVDHETRGNSVVAGDFDNDGWVDLYILSSGTVANRPNTLYRNLGGGVFETMKGAAGAEGTLLGRGDCVVTGDYDGDGFLDLFLTNGAGTAPFFDGPHELFRNRGNENHWLELQLIATRTGRDATGARVFVEEGGRVQVREQHNGTHRYSQNDRTLHFGLGRHAGAARIVIEWPSGARQAFAVAQIDQLLTIQEP